jgi:hypothetical protein
MKKRIVIVKVFASDEKGKPIDYLACDLPAPRKPFINRLHHWLIKIPWQALSVAIW